MLYIRPSTNKTKQKTSIEKNLLSHVVRTTLYDANKHATAGP